MRYILPYILLVLLAVSCNKSKHPCEGKDSQSYITISSYFSSYQFKEGTYWVYENDATAEIDSQRVVSAIDTRVGSGGGSSCGSSYAQLYNMQVKSYLNNNYFHYVIVTSSFNKKDDDPYSPGGSTILTSNDIKEPADISSMTINGHTFSNVRKVSAYQSNFYFVDAVGLVKWEEVSGSTVLESWSIKSWDAVL